jgi:hypothetical protein
MLIIIKQNSIANECRLLEHYYVETESIYTRPAHSPFQSVEITKRCPKCKSVFITEKECESCHFQFTIEPVGTPYGFKSVTYIRSDFANDFPVINYFKNNFSYKVSSTFPAVIEYKRKLNRRREVLSRYLFESVRGERETRKLFFTELLDICYELIDLDSDVFQLLDRLEGHEKHPYYEKLTQLLVIHQQNKVSQKNIVNNFLNFSLFGLLRVRFLLVFGAITSLILMASLFIYSELIGLIS